MNSNDAVFEVLDRKTMEISDELVGELALEFHKLTAVFYIDGKLIAHVVGREAA